MRPAALQQALGGGDSSWFEQSLLHITLNMNRRRRSPRSEVSQETIDLLSALIQKPAFAIPGQAAYRCDVFEPGNPLAVQVREGRPARESGEVSPTVS